MANFIAFDTNISDSSVLGLEDPQDSNSKAKGNTNYRALRDTIKDTTSFLSTFKSNLSNLSSATAKGVIDASSHFLASFKKPYVQNQTGKSAKSSGVQTGSATSRRSSFFQNASLQTATASKSSSSSQFSQILANSKLSILDSPSASILSHYVPPGSESRRRLKASRKSVRDSVKNGIVAPELTDTTKNDLEALSLRSVLDTKHFYKRNHMSVKPKYFQVGKILENPEDYYSSRVPKRQRKRGIAEEMLQDARASGANISLGPVAKKHSKNKKGKAKKSKK